MVVHELPFPTVWENGVQAGYGGNQEWFSQVFQRTAGCASVTGGILRVPDCRKPRSVFREYGAIFQIGISAGHGRGVPIHDAGADGVPGSGAVCTEVFAVCRGARKYLSGAHDVPPLRL